MRHIIELKNGWQFTNLDGQTSEVSIPHTWNAIDGQDGGDDYKRGTCTYTLALQKPEFDTDTQEVWIEFDGVNASAQVSLNGQEVCSHDGGYSTFRANLTDLLADENTLSVKVDNSKNDRVYPQMADFTFYGGIYRMVRLLVVNKAHFALDYLGSSGIRVTATPEGAGAKVRVQSRVTTGDVTVTVIDRKGRVVGTGTGLDTTIEMAKARRWHGVEDPYLYTARCEVTVDGSVTDRLEIPFGVRSFRVDEKHGFILNDEPYDLHGVSRHQDRKGIGNAITREMHDEDMALIREIGATTLRLAHYQHDQYFYDLCDRNGLIVWAEIPYISKHMPNGRANTISQMEELIEQNYNHASIVCWGVSNEITIATKDKQDMLDNHRLLNDMIHQTDPTRFTTLRATRCAARSTRLRTSPTSSAGTCIWAGMCRGCSSMTCGLASGTCATPSACWGTASTAQRGCRTCIPIIRAATTTPRSIRRCTTSTCCGASGGIRGCGRTTSGTCSTSRRTRAIRAANPA